MQITIPSYSTRSLVYYLATHGFALDDLLHICDSSLEKLNDVEEMFEVEIFESLLALGAKDDPEIGMNFGCEIEPDRWGLLGHIVTCCSTLWEAMQKQKSYQGLLGNAGNAFYSEDNGEITLRWLCNYHSSVYMSEATVAAWISFAQRMVKLPATPSSVHFTHSCPGNVKHYEEKFECPVFFNSKFNGAVTTVEIMQRPLSGFNSDVLNVLCCHADSRLQQKQKSASLDLVTNYIIDVLPDHVPDLNEVASYLGISTRQLQRKFSDEETNLTTLLEGVRKNLAISYLLQTDDKLITIAHALGYSEQSVLQRAFKRWTGKTPKEFREHPVALSS